MRTTPPIPLSIKRALAKLGGDIRSARIRRRITAEVMAQRSFITRVTLRKVERGDPTVTMASYATVLFVLGLADRLSNLADITKDDLGLQLEEERLPLRVRGSSPAKR